MRQLCLVIFICSIICYSHATKCYNCTDVEENCNNGMCEGDWCTAIYVTKNPFANDQEHRVIKSCGGEHPMGLQNDTCVESISPSGRKLSCGCRGDYCNGDKPIQQLPVQEDGGSVAAVTGNSATTSNETRAFPEAKTNNETTRRIAKGRNLKCFCTEDQLCIKNECTGSYCIRKIYGEAGLLVPNMGSVPVGIKIARGCATSLPIDLVGNVVKTETTITLPDGSSARVNATIHYCDSEDYCNKAHYNRALLPAIFLGVFTVLYLHA